MKSCILILLLGVTFSYIHASCQAEILGLSSTATHAQVYVVNQRQHSEAKLLEVKEGKLLIDMPADSFVTAIVQ